MDVGWNSFVSSLAREASLPPKNKEEQTKEAFFQKYVSTQSLPLSGKKFQASSSRSLLVKHPQIQLLATPFEQNEQVRMIQCLAAFGEKATNNKMQETLFFWSQAVKKATNETILHLILEANSISKDDTPQLLLKAMQLLVEMSDDINSCIPFLNDYHSQKLNLQQLYFFLDRRKSEIDQERYPEKPLETVRNEFLTPSDPHVLFPLKQQEAHRYFHQYSEILQIENTLKHKDLKEWVKEVKSIRERCQNRAILHKDFITLVAIGRLAISYKFKIRPYNTQILTVLALLQYDPSFKGRIAQVRTGEGKSTVTALLAFVEACQGKVVDVVSSSRYLSERDAEKYAPFFADFDIEVSHICTDSPTISHFKGQIVYGTNFDFEFTYMRDKASSQPKRVTSINDKTGPRPFHVVIVDEVDNMFIDSALNSARIAIPSITTRGWIYPIILKFVQERKMELILTKLFTGTTNSFVESLINHLKEVNNGQFAKEIQEIDEEDFEIWISSALSADLHHQENKHYVVKHEETDTHLITKPEKSVVIVDWNNTGRLNKKSRWQDGLHEFLEAKHELEVKQESYTSSSLCHPIYFGFYDKIFGLTGTLGKKIEREEIEKIYGIDTFDVPPHKQNLRQILEPIVADTKEKHTEALLNELYAIQNAERPLLMLFESIEDTTKFSDVLKEKSIPHQVLNEMQQEEEDFIIARAGMSKVITIATNTAGRGTDIILDRKSRMVGGLHVVFAFFPTNDRVELQGFGRAGRQGQPGSCRLIIQSQKSIISLYREREAQVKKLSDSRIEEVNIERAHYAYLKSYWTHLQKFYARSPNEFTVQKLDQWLTKAKLQLDQKDQLGLDTIEVLINAAKDPANFGMDQEIFGKEAMENLATFAEQQWGRLFYSRLRRKQKGEDALEALYESSKRIWGLYLE